jgi:amidase
MRTATDDAHRTLVAEVTAAVEDYERALTRHDLDALHEWFSEDPCTLRADAHGVLIGRQAIDEFRRRSPGALPRTVDRLHIVPLADSAAIAVAETLRPDGTRGLQTQAWVKTLQGWKISAAHVSVSPPTAAAAPAGDPAGQSPPEDLALWRVKGTPLVRGAEGATLSGRTVAVKDTYTVAGFARGAGNPTWLAEAAVEQENASAVTALLAAGADIMGIAQTDEFAYSLAGTNVHYGTPPNPAASGRIPGGSSSAPASAVASGLVDIGLGSDTAGSIRVPASYCGLFGLRPTHGAISTQGLLPLAPAFDTVGWMTRDAATLEAVAAVLLPEGDTQPPECLLLAEDLFALADPDVQAALREPAGRIASRLGLPLKVVPTLCEQQLDNWAAAFGTVQAAQAWKAHGPWLADHPDALEPEIAQRFANGRAVTPHQLETAQETLVNARNLLAEHLRPGTILVQPAASTPAPPPQMSDEDKAAMRAGTLRLTCVASIAGLPAVALPAALVENLPVGLCLVGRRGTDRTLVALARQAAPS